MARWIAKASDEVLSYCSCVHPLAALPGQLDCPWCGCGYLMSCSFCRKAFTFGSIISVDRSCRDMVEADRRRGGYDMSDADLDEEAEMIENMLSSFEKGDTVVYLDGCYLDANARNLRFDGLFAHHDLMVLPHQLARAGLAPLNETVGQASYWLQRERQERG